MLNMSWRPFCEVVTARFVPGQIIMVPPRSSFRVAVWAPAAMEDPLITLVPEFASTTPPLTLASEANSSPTFCWARAAPASSAAVRTSRVSAWQRGNCDVGSGGVGILDLQHDHTAAAGLKPPP